MAKIREAREALRRAVADQYIERLPDVLTIQQAGHLFGASDREVFELILSGDLVARRGDDGILIAPSDNAELLMAGSLLRMPVPEEPSHSDTVWIELALTRGACTELNRRAEQHATTPSLLIETLLVAR